MKKFTVYLYRAPDCRRGWLAYLRPNVPATLTVLVEAESGQKAKNAAITAANNEFKGLEIIGKNFDHRVFGINLFPDLEWLKP